MKKITDFRGDYRWLSNFYICSFSCHDMDLNSVEHGFQAMKTLNYKEQNKVLRASTPSEAKKIGRHVTLRKDWFKVRNSIMYDLVLAKFEQNDYLADKLIETGDMELIEGNTWNDTYWGVCKGKGSNHLGKILMRVRSELV